MRQGYDLRSGLGSTYNKRQALALLVLVPGAGAAAMKEKKKMLTPP
eukprot:CAMPEP_0178988378 /NCGR_PEP_ID=MMETSP0795-20121207/3779_1 /TAXON_ID=88552 /ORGANISM="Amoebophrya sp., Strain Ameob2" /LENGTH=45 /DNA_ID= /DNA_START= /DNA_END= /DNA_ORIENTATION=